MDLPVAVVTGGASGIGLAVATELAKTHRVALLDINGEAVERAARELGGLGFQCDVSDAGSVAAAIDGVIRRYESIDVAVSIAGIGAVGTARHLDPGVLAKTLDINLVGAWRFMHACLPHLVKSKGYLLGVVSGAALFAPPTSAMYAASKAGLEALLDAVRSEVAYLGIDVGVAYPLMVVDTPMIREGERQHADLAWVHSRLPRAMRRSLPASAAAAMIVRGIRRRSPRIFMPSVTRGEYLLRGVLRPVVDIAARRLGAKADQLTEAKVRERGPFAAAFASRAVQTAREESGAHVRD